MRRLAARLVAWAAPLVPGDVRAEWLREWQAEIAWTSRASPGLLLRATGAWVHAAWLRWDRWRVEMLLHDVRDALRGLVRRRGFALVTLLTLALGIGASAAIFSAVHAVLLRPLPFPAPDRIVQVYSTTREAPDARGGSVSPPDFVDWRSSTSSFSDLAALTSASLALTGIGPAEQISGAYVTGSFFSLLAVSPLHGRRLLPADDTVNGPAVAVLGHGVWTRRFGGDTSVVGRLVTLDGVPHRVVGVMPAGFAYPLGADIWVPLRFTAEELRTQRGAHYLDVIGRLARGVALDTARADVRVLVRRLAAQYPRTNREKDASVFLLRDALVGDVRPALLLLLGAVGFVLLIVCVNVANLVLSRALGRTRELAVRSTLGASRGRLLRGLLVESVMLAIGGGLAGLALASWAGRAIAALDAGLGIPLIDGTRTDGAVVAFTAAVTLAAALLFGTLPAWQSSSIADLARRIREAGTTVAGDRRSGRTRAALIVVETALAVVLLVGAGLLARSFVRLMTVDLGFDGDRVQTFSISLPETRYNEPSLRAAFVQGFVDDLAARPDVASAGAVFGLPLSDFSYGISLYSLDGRVLPDEEQDRHILQVRVVTPDYFRTMRIPVRRGRAFTRGDRAGAPPVAVLSESAAAQVWPGGDALGHRLTIGTTLGQGGERVGGEVIGVAGDVHHFGPGTQVKPTIYVAHAQFPISFVTVAARARRDPSALVGPARDLLAARDADVPMFRIRSVPEFQASAVAQPRVYAVLLALFAGAAVLLAAVGIYGVLAESVRQRTREIGVRVALGAARAEVVGMVLRRGGLLAVVGVGLGLVMAGSLSRLLGNLLFGVEPLDPATYAAVSAALLAVALAACIVPAWRAARVDPVTALRSE